MFHKFTFKNFRCFDRLHFDELDRINLIAGFNNSGKTSVLEGLFLFAGGNNPNTIFQLNGFRGLVDTKVDDGAYTDMPWAPLFKDFNSECSILLEGIDSIGTKNSLQISDLKASDISDSVKIEARSKSSTDYPSNIRSASRVLEFKRRQEWHPNSTKRSRKHELKQTFLVLDGSGMKIESPLPSPEIRAFYMGARGKTSQSVEAERFGNLSVHHKEDRLIDSLKHIEPRLQNLKVIPYSGSSMIFADLGLERLIPLPLSGEGMVRLTSMLLSIYSSPGGIVLVDEIENGLHHTVMQKVWESIRYSALEADVQIFATTHSQECIEAAHSAFSEEEEYAFRLFRLENVEGETIVKSYDREILDSSIDLAFDVR
ncbi:MAG: ATP-binding protein [Planctomycetes bacterium]|nr:ATP-binding protein [Planctomycetota bacterium]